MLFFFCERILLFPTYIIACSCFVCLFLATKGSDKFHCGLFIYLDWLSLLLYSCPLLSFHPPPQEIFHFHVLCILSLSTLSSSHLYFFITHTSTVIYIKRQQLGSKFGRHYVVCIFVSLGYLSFTYLFFQVFRLWMVGQ